MAIAFYDVNSATGLEKLDEYLITYSYITGYQASKDDLTVYIALSKSTSSDYVNTSRWYNHIDAPEAVTTPPFDSKVAAAEDDDDDDDNDVDLPSRHLQRRRNLESLLF
ncbi:hypothetical protein QYF36_024370 [Acer negundo]|nr:hypothetical protein QYF36_024370 [Acer negundo]